jgi:hypothetical protein
VAGKKVIRSAKKRDHQECQEKRSLGVPGKGIIRSVRKKDHQKFQEYLSSVVPGKGGHEDC